MTCIRVRLIHVLKQHKEGEQEMKPLPKSLMSQGQTIEQQRILRWISENVDCARLSGIAFLDRSHVRLTYRAQNHYLVTYHKDGSITMQEITEAC